MDRQRPTWLTERCPAWCARDHRESDHPEDRRHQSEAVIVSAAAPADPIAVDRTSTTVEMAILLDRPVGAATTWVRIEGLEVPQPRLTVTTAAARVLVAEVDAIVEQADGPRPRGSP